MANPLINTAGAMHEYTKDEITELLKCSQDIFYFAEKYCVVIHPKKGKLPCILRDYQKRFVNAMLDNSKVICLASRQLGKCCCSTTSINVKFKNKEKKQEMTLKEIFEVF